jgi:hypothetical protein
MLSRQCTARYKIEPFQSFTFHLINRKYSRHRVRKWLGISTDEAHRMKISRTQYIENYYPLIELGMSRTDCLQWIAEHGFKTPPKSSCIICPFHSDEYWLRMKNNSPGEFEMACAYDDRLRLNSSMGETWLHQSRQSLRIVNLESKKKFSNKEAFMECSGNCFT